MILKNETQGNYVIVSQSIMHDPSLRMFDRGTMATLLSLPDNWEFTIDGLTKIVKDGRDALKSSLKRLEERGYLVIEQLRENGQFSGNCLRINVNPEKPLPDKPLAEKPSTEIPSTVCSSSMNPSADIPTQSNNNISNIHESIKDTSTTEEDMSVVVDAKTLFADLNMADEDIRAIVSASGNDLSKCSKALDILRQQNKPVGNVVGWLIRAVREGYRMPTAYKGSGTYGESGMLRQTYDYEALEKQLVAN